MIHLQTILDELTKHHPQADLDLVRRAYVYGVRSHRGQTRRSGDPYIMHPLEVALIVSKLHLDAPSVCAGLLHDTVEDTDATVEEVSYQFGGEVSTLVESLTKLNKINFMNQEEAQAANFRKMLIAMSRDLRVILIKLSDRLHNMRTLGNLPAEKQKRISKETLDIYAPLASRLGLYGIKVEMEDLCFKYLHMDEYKQIADLIQKTKVERERYINRVTEELYHHLNSHDVQRAEVSGRPKHLWSIRQKLKRTGAGFDTLYDILAFRIIVSRVSLCYEVLGLIHSVWKPIPGRFKDYIALPKQNGYQSLHTAVFGPDNERIEVQIRTDEMHESSELGVAAHWVYKEQGNQQKRRRQPMSPDENFIWLRQLLEWQRDLKDPNDFLDAVRVDLFDEEVYIFTPQGEVKPLPRGATPIDFAYAIHTTLGNECTGATVNGRIVNLRYELQNGDICQIARTRGSHPKADWLKFVKTGRAATKIRSVHRAEANEQSLIAGHEVTERELKKYGYSLNRFRKEGLMDQLIQSSRLGNERELFLDFGYGKIDPTRLISSLFADSDGNIDVDSSKDSSLDEHPQIEKKPRSNAIIVDGEEGLAIHYPKCCSPIQGDEVAGFVTLGRGVTIHRSDCPHCLDYDPARRVPVSWKKDRYQSRPVDLRIYSDDVRGLLASISQVLHQAGANIGAVNCQTMEGQRAINDFTIIVDDVDHLQRVTSNLRQVKGVIDVERITR